MFNSPKIILTSMLLALVPACSQELSKEEQEILDARMAEEKQPTNMIAVLQGDADLSTAGILIGLSGVGAEMQDNGPYTAFVATNEAFNKIDAQELSELLSADNKDELKSIAEYGLVQGSRQSPMAAALRKSPPWAAARSRRRWTATRSRLKTARATRRM